MKDYWKIDEDLVRHISLISKLNLTNEEMTGYSKDLNDVLESFRILEEVDITGVDAAFHPLSVENAFREDTASKEKDNAWDPLSATENKEGDYYKGPKII
ncbi:MAG: Asp-tRNA(Asn)/Glu-tRNA(Gln) amidotransferase subunit GatC [Candidatus Marsarchaeota archaeon]|nr:Asp-tRNA(Asn)/Glu-tRNA(Gln) amidotransferase subunit GatC [Candidatus Marsarchaeota archaeon]